ncbi:MAG TPA: bifunctional glutamate N-acetyltransferase/amino-acid acetyltransferase ArgJ [Ilumatobacteraceae bacterium]|nr:bifunctional glutamate N-acetyltransferase/amino-acid acetyltransferase ArgJ [Ilumatobacteraceae bacterium]HQY86804.1 bifunctional glutamate N-acetyltransferase/amino-acid acetyltransferase ArgJ [Ilumatobacteraceae bacterium]HRA86365.1 bifunctional glutamate N-acetyltransferase/amino-acid acetyltransferase ArgJ [Ilumatobacteraceae bacterium]HRC48986.1 bifunctional glutamate N-acetyltransferase/amino-acid acetyltransferase ArgJ [Ilumatobacteraceae bacterium]
MNEHLALPRGFHAHVANIGVKDTTDDFTIVASDVPCAAAGVFTQSSFAGPSVLVSRLHVAHGTARAMVVISKNANVATGAQGLADAHEVVAGVAAALGCSPTDVLIASTGVIGRSYPMDHIRAGLAAIPSPLPGTDAGQVARGIMTTDTVPKTASATVGNARIVGVAKGVGMIEPNMATMIAMFFTDAALSAPALDAVFRRVIDRTLNCVSIDTDTSTSDTAVIIANGVAGTVDDDAFEAALCSVAESLTKQIARDGEGATTLLEVTVDGATSTEQARRVARAIVNSPLVKTAVHGADPNWGRVAMAVGKCTTSDEVDQRAVIIRFGTQEVYPARLDDDDLAALSAYMRGPDVLIHVSLATGGTATATVWGCDLTDGYVRINADYTT